jgi:multidrug resistance efflux pump
MTSDIKEDQPGAGGEQAEEKPVKAKMKPDPVRRWTFIVLFTSIVLLVLYLLGDRQTPYTSQARVHAYVVPIAAEVSGAIVSVDVQNNQQVSAGQLLFQLDSGNYQLAVESAEAALRNTLQSVDAGVANVDAAQANVQTAKASLWSSEQDAVRMRRIRKEDPGAISERRLESAEASLAAARGRLAAAESALEAAKSTLGSTDESNAQIRQAQSALDKARLDLERTTVSAPSDGLITDLRIDQGNFAAAGAPLMTFIAIHDIWIQADLTENNLGNVDVGDRVEITFDVLPGKVFEGRIRETGLGVQIATNALGTLPTIENDRAWLREAQRFPVVIEFDAAEVGASDLRVGSQASVIVYTGNNWIMNLLGRFYIRIQALFSYAY